MLAFSASSSRARVGLSAHEGISSRQDSLLEELHEMTRRIEKLSQREHDLISDVHPKVKEIKEDVENVREAVSPENE